MLSEESKPIENNTRIHDGKHEEHRQMMNSD